MAKLENKTKENPKLEQNKLSDGRRQSQPASATLRNIFEKDLSRSREIE
ncbi:hypothetical protein H9625_15815, partial [Phocaeicola sp. Sa1CVN1]|nr:hypothetical protein [Phocaeicola intestinalis]